MVCKLLKALYGLKQAPRLLYERTLQIIYLRNLTFPHQRQFHHIHLESRY